MISRLSRLAMIVALTVPAAAQQNFKWVPVGAAAPTVFYSVSTADKKAGTVSVMVAFMRKSSNPGESGNSGSMRSEMILCGHNGYEDTHQSVDGSMHAAAESFQTFDFNKPGVMELISKSVCPKP
jgi:hypothetical protein